MKQDGSVWSAGGAPACGGDLDGGGKSFVQVISKGAMAAAAGDCFSIVLKQDGSVWATGEQSGEQLSFTSGTTITRREFSLVELISGAEAVSAGGYHSMVLTHEGHVWVTGWNKYGQLGNGLTTREGYTRFFSAISSGAQAVAAGDLHSIVLKQDGSVWAAGRNYNGQLGDGSRTDKSHFVKVMASGAADVGAGGYHSMVLKEDGSVWATGWNEYGQLGNGLTTDVYDYIQVAPSGAKAVAAGSRHSMILMQDGSVWTAGFNMYGQLGDGWTSNTAVYVKVIADGAKTIAAGAFHSMVLKADNSIWATGSNQEGQFGDRSTTSAESFIRLAPTGNGARYHVIMYATTSIFNSISLLFGDHDVLNR